MDVIYKVCCGIDVHKNKLVACLKIKGKKNVIKEYSGQTEDIKSMANWLKEAKCEKIAMESTASYWKPLVNIFEITNLKYTVINAQIYMNSYRIEMKKKKKMKKLMKIMKIIILFIISL